jgi:mono/diheme cytochrome c family protein
VSDEAEVKRSRSLWPFLLGWAAGLASVGLVAAAVIALGAFDTTALAGHPPLIAWATHLTMIRSTKVHAANVKPPKQPTVDQLYAGFRGYDSECAMCHGAPGVDRARWVKGMTPPPPYLLDAARVWSRKDLYWIVGRGVKMTAMPAWLATRSDADVWNVVGFLEMLPCISPADYQRLRATGGRPPAAMPTSCPNPRRRPRG